MLADLKSALTTLHVSPANIDLFVPHLQPILAINGIDTDLRVAAFLSQAVYESKYFTVLEEDLYYTTLTALSNAFTVGKGPNASDLLRNPQKLANLAYANRLGNGDSNSGDGWKFRGRGVFQLTGLYNYTKMSSETGRPYVSNPDLVAQPYDAILTAAQYWTDHSLNAKADNKDIQGITLIINGPRMLGLTQRTSLFNSLIPS